MLEYSALNDSVFNKIPGSATKILDVGCGTGIMGKALKSQDGNRIVYGVTYSDKEAVIAKQFLNKVFVSDLNKEIPPIIIKFDCLIFSHVLEHTFYPENILKNFLRFLKDDGIIVIALPNVLQYKQRFRFLKGAFKYSTEGGLMDITHFRFFDWQTAQEMIKNAGLKILLKEASGNFPLPFFRRLFPNLVKKVDELALKNWPGLFSFQFVFVATA